MSSRVIVLGGGIARSANLFVPMAQATVGDFAELRVSALGDHAPLVGAGAGLIGGAATGNKQVEIPTEAALSFNPARR